MISSLYFTENRGRINGISSVCRLGLRLLSWRAFRGRGRLEGIAVVDDPEGPGVAGVYVFGGDSRIGYCGSFVGDSSGLIGAQAAVKPGALAGEQLSGGVVSLFKIEDKVFAVRGGHALGAAAANWVFGRGVLDELSWGVLDQGTRGKRIVHAFPLFITLICLGTLF